MIKKTKSGAGKPSRIREGYVHEKPARGLPKIIPVV